MEIKLILQKDDIEEISVKQFMNLLKFFNKDKTEAYFKNIGNESIEIVVLEKEYVKLCRELGIKHFNNQEDYVNWLVNKSKNAK